MIPLWAVIIGIIVFAGMFVREIILNNSLTEELNLVSQYLGYMMLRFDYNPTWEEMINLVGVSEEKIDELLKKQEEEKS